MDRFIDRDIALDIVQDLIRQETQNGIDENNEMLQQLLVMREEIYKDNAAVIETVIKGFKNAVDAGDKNGNNN